MPGASRAGSLGPRSPLLEPSHTNPWLETVGLPMPDLEALAADPQLKLRDLLIAALLERGEPLSAAQAAARLEPLGVTSATGDLVYSLTKAGHGAPLYKDAQGRFGLDLHSPAWLHLRFTLAPRRPPPPPRLLPSDDVPLALDDLRRGLKGRSLFGVPLARQAAAVLDAHGRPLSAAEVEAFLHALTPIRPGLRDDYPSAASRPGLVSRGADGLLHLTDDVQALRRMRAAMRRFLDVVLRHPPVDREASRASVEEHLQRERRAAAERRRAVLHGFFHERALAAVTLLDVSARSLRTWIGDELAGARDACAPFDVLIGLDTRATAEALGLPTLRCRVVDLEQRPKTKRLNRQGRLLSIDLPLLFRGSVGLSRALGEPRKLSEYFEAGERTRLVRRMESDAKALLALYAYGVLHRGVRVRWGFLDELAPVAWAEPGDPTIQGLLHSLGRGERLEVVHGSAPGWDDPWARARRVVRAALPWGPLVVEGPDGERTIALADVQAARVVPAPAP